MGRHRVRKFLGNQPQGSVGQWDIEQYTHPSPNNLVSSYAQSAHLSFPVVPPTVSNSGTLQNAGPGPHKAGAYFATHGPPGGVEGANSANSGYSVVYTGGEENEMLLAAIWSG